MIDLCGVVFAGGWRLRMVLRCGMEVNFLRRDFAM